MTKKQILAILMMILAATALAQGRRQQSPPVETGYPGPVVEPELPPKQQQNINQLFSDLQSIKGGSAVTQEQKKQLIVDLVKDLNAMADGATKPDPKTIDRLATDLAAAFDDGKLSNLDLRKVITDVDKILDSAGIPSTEVNALIADVQTILATSGITRTEVDAVVKDLKAIVGTAKEAPKAHRR